MSIYGEEGGQERIWSIYGTYKQRWRLCLLTDNEDADEANYAKLHVVIVKENIGKMCCKECINPTAGAHEINICIKHRRTQGTCKKKKKKSNKFYFNQFYFLPLSLLIGKLNFYSSQINIQFSVFLLVFKINSSTSLEKKTRQHF